MIVAQKILNTHEYKRLKREIKKISMLPGDEREYRLSEMYDRYECDLKYIGVTAVEDRL